MKSSLTSRLALIAATLALLAGCSSQELYSQLTERQANEMVAVLRSVGIDAEKRVQEGKFSVLTASGDFPQAVRALSAQGLPREQFDSMGTVFKREGFVSSRFGPSTTPTSAAASIAVDRNFEVAVSRSDRRAGSTPRTTTPATEPR